MANIGIFLSACDELKVKTSLKDADIERLKPDDWNEVVRALISFSQKLESKNPSMKSFKVDLQNLKLSIDQLKREWNVSNSGINDKNGALEEDIYQSPYKDIDVSMTVNEDDSTKYQNIVS